MKGSDMDNLFHFFEYHNSIDVEGRPLSEDKTVTSKAEFEFIECPYSGNRKGKLMNASAWNQYTRNRLDVDAWIEWANAFARFYFPELSGSIVARVWSSSLVLRWIIHFRFFTRPTYIPSGSLSTCYKFSRGTYDLSLHHFIQGLDLNNTSVETMVELAEVQGFLESKSGVCAAPTAVIRQTLDKLQSKDSSFYLNPPDSLELDNEQFVTYLKIMVELEFICGTWVLNTSLGSPASIHEVNSVKNSAIERAELYGRVVPYGFYDRGVGLHLDAVPLITEEALKTSDNKNKVHFENKIHELEKSIGALNGEYLSC